jgi:threonine aldolase
VLAGTSTFIRQARAERNRFGGGMRQAGFLAAAGLYALRHNRQRLKEDHAHARLLGETLQSRSFVKAVHPVETNIVMFELIDHNKRDPLLVLLEGRRILAVPFGPGIIRFVTHLDIHPGMIGQVKDALKEVEQMV